MADASDEKTIACVARECVAEIRAYDLVDALQQDSRRLQVDRDGLRQSREIDDIDAAAAADEGVGSTFAPEYIVSNAAHQIIVAAGAGKRIGARRRANDVFDAAQLDVRRRTARLPLKAGQVDRDAQSGA